MSFPHLLPDFTLVVTHSRQVVVLLPFQASLRVLPETQAQVFFKPRTGGQLLHPSQAPSVPAAKQAPYSEVSHG